MAAHIVKPELLAQEIGQRASVNELAAVIQQPGDIRNGRRLRQRPLDLVLRVHAASMRCARSIVQLYLRVKGRARVGNDFTAASSKKAIVARCNRTGASAYRAVWRDAAGPLPSSALSCAPSPVLRPSLVSGPRMMTFPRRSTIIR